MFKEIELLPEVPKCLTNFDPTKFRPDWKASGRRWRVDKASKCLDEVGEALYSKGVLRMSLMSAVDDLRKVCHIALLLGANYLLGCPSWFLSIMFCIVLVHRSPFWRVPGLLHQHTHFCHSFVWNTLSCSPESLLRSHLQSIGSVFLSVISLEEGLAQNSWSLPLTSLQIKNR